LENQVVKEKYPELHALWQREPHKIKFPGGESLDEVRSRTMKGMEDLLAKHKNENFVLVAHRVPNKVICCALLGLDNSHFWRIQQDTASTNLFIFRDDQWIISFLNDTSYLKSLGKPSLSDF
jgi:broad specificity phosphatase PhoE